MTSERKILANRQNARRSTGPRSAAGKTRSKLNALSHGLATKVAYSKLASKDIQRFTRHIAQDLGIEVDADVTFSLAEAEFDIVRVRKARVALLENIIVKEKFDRAAIRKKLDQIYAARILLAPFEPSDSLGGRVLSHALERSLENLLATPVSKVPVSPEVAFAVVVARLANYDRYEGLAISRRRRTIIKLDNLQKDAKSGASISVPSTS